MKITLFQDLGGMEPDLLCGLCGLCGSYFYSTRELSSDLFYGKKGWGG